MQDGELFMLHHYLQKGFDPEKLINLPYRAKLFYAASMEIDIEDEVEKTKAMAGGVG